MRRIDAIGYQTAAVVGMFGAVVLLSVVATHLESETLDNFRRRLSGNEGGDACGDVCDQIAVKFGPVLDLVLMLYVFLGMAIVCDDFFQESLEKISEALKLTPDVAGATFLAAGSSAPELFTSLAAAFISKTEAGLGTIVGSAMFNLLIIVALSAAVAGRGGARLKIDWRPMARDSSFYCLSIVLLGLFFSVTGPGEITTIEAGFMVFVYGLYILFMVYNQQILDKCKPVEKYTVHPEQSAEGRAVAKAAEAIEAGTNGAAAAETNGSEDKEAPTKEGEAADTTGSNGDEASKGGADAEEEPDGFWDRFNWPEPEDGEEWSPKEVYGYKFMHVLKMPFVVLMSFTIPDCALPRFENWYWASFFMSILWIGALCHFMVEFALELGSCYLHLSPVIMGVLFLAIGTSVPDAIGSMIAARNGEADMAIANAIGSNVFDVLLGLGLPWFLFTIVYDTPFPVDAGNVGIPIVILFVTVLLFLAVMTANKFWMTTQMGMMLTGIYVLYILWTIIAAQTGIVGGC